MAVSHNDSVTRAYKSFFRENRVAYAVTADVKEIFYSLAVCPVTQDFSLFGSLAVFSRRYMVYYSLYFRAVEYFIHTAVNKIVYRNRRSYFVTEYAVKLQYVCIRKW